MDSNQGITTQEKRIAEQIEEAGKGCILLFNKWDLVKGFRMEHCLKGVQMEASFLSYCPTMFVSALNGRNLEDLFSLIREVVKQRKQRITTGQLNKFVEQVFQKYHPPMIQGKRLRVYYMTQVQSSPPRFILFVNYPELMLDSYKKYMINQFREEYGFKGVPLLFDLKGKQGNQHGDVPVSEKRPQAIELDLEMESEEESEIVFEEMPDLQEEFDPSYFS
jgi:GTP-binding protein